MPNKLANEPDLIRLAQGGDIEAFSQLVTAYQTNICACLAIRLNSNYEVDDLAQEVFIVAFRRLAEFDAERALGPWLRGIAFNLLRSTPWLCNRCAPHVTEGLPCNGLFFGYELSC